jgi:upstream activation factor subunit UAF30
MPSAGKKSSKTTEPAPAPAPAPAPVASTKSTKQTKSATKKDTEKTSAPAPAPVVEQKVATDEVNVVVATDSTASVSANFGEFFTRFQKLLSEFGHLRSELKTLEKRTMKELKVVNKMNNKRKKKPQTRAPSGFVKPTKISDELASFLGKPFGSEMARTEVTREINAYIRANNLQDKTNGRKINPDTQLAKLLKVTDKDELTYFNLQRYMSPHFTKKAVAESA